MTNDLLDVKEKFDRIVDLGIVNDNGHLLSGLKHVIVPQPPKDKFQEAPSASFNLDELMESTEKVQKEIVMMSKNNDPKTGAVQNPEDLA